jgi:hypothetical protein
MDESLEVLDNPKRVDGKDCFIISYFVLLAFTYLLFLLAMPCFGNIMNCEKCENKYLNVTNGTNVTNIL